MLIKLSYLQTCLQSIGASGSASQLCIHLQVINAIILLVIYWRTTCPQELSNVYVVSTHVSVHSFARRDRYVGATGEFTSTRLTQFRKMLLSKPIPKLCRQ